MMLRAGSIRIALFLGLAVPAVSFGQECLDTRPRFADLYPDPFAVPQRQTFILGSRLPTEGYFFTAYCENGELNELVMDADLQVTWQFFISTPLPDPLDRPCPDEDGERVRSAATQWLEQGPAWGRVLGGVCVGEGVGA